MASTTLRTRPQPTTAAGQAGARIVPVTSALPQRTRTTVHGSAVVVGDLCRSVAARAWGRTASADTYSAWLRADRPVPPPPVVKQRTILDYAKTHGLHVLVETGTYVGDMVAALAGDFEDVYSIELSAPLHMLARARFVGRRNIHLAHGDSSVHLRRLLREVRRPCLFWLDGHFCGGITANGSGKWPLLEELDAIFSHPIVGHVILVDDARYLRSSDHEHDAPSLATIRAAVLESGVPRTLSIRDDIVRIVPQESA